MTLRLRRKRRTTVRVRQLASQLSYPARTAGGLVVLAALSLSLLANPATAQQNGPRTFNPPVHIQPGQQNATQRYSGIVAPQGRNPDFSRVGSAPAQNGRGGNPGQQQRRAPQLQNRIAQALSNMAGRGNQQQASAIPVQNFQAAPQIPQGNRSHMQRPTMGYHNQEAIGTGVRTNQPMQARGPATGYAQSANVRFTRQPHLQQPQMQQQLPSIQRQPTPRSFPVQQIDTRSSTASAYPSAQTIAAETYYDRPDIQATSAQQFEEEIYLEQEPEIRIAQTPAQLPGLQESAMQAEPVSVLRTVPENYSEPNYREQGEDPVFAPNAGNQPNDLRVQTNQDQDAEDIIADEEQDGLQRKSFDKTCDQLRNELLNRPITEIALDISPIKNPNQTEYRPQYRTWTDQFGRQIANGVITAVRRGYVVVEDGGNFQRIPFGNLSDPDLEVVALFWQTPKECTISQDVFLGRNWQPQTLTWKASNLCHKPLYFENIQLERYGHSRGPFSQPVHSTFHFFSSLVLLPYNRGINPPNECRYALGYYRPGDCAPWLEDPFPISLAGAGRQVSSMVGGAYLITP
ncbi:hypothetical protein OAG68_02970 [bacterium]|nr:hypothetical protein [bacterium]